MKKSILITGGSRGIGAATSLLAAQRGYHVFINYVNDAEAALKVVDQIKQNGGAANALQADVSVESEVVQLFKDIDAHGTTLTALVNNAGILQKQKHVVDMDSQRLLQVLGVNVIGSFLCAREAIKRMSTKRGGHGGAIVNLTSNSVRTGAPNEYVDYAASKGAIDAFTIGLAREVADDGIRVNGVRPGVIVTDIHASGGDSGRVDRIKSTIPMKRGGTSEEVANGILWLLSEEASYCTGATLDITGGR
jgi:NAD(P)-dependent dehydrogenase (short-subunit alcohol dehydrogenase family)